ncbi:MAG: ATP synthase F0 subunit B [Clostridia bacterium]|nr:ATP synthase F0 subunit B [Clostridia bacterium]
MPLNIDWQQILLHLLNFAILFCVLFFLLYNPIKKFMKKREDYYKNIDDEANKKLSDAEELKSSYENKLKASDEEIAEKQKAAYDSFSKEIDEQRAEAEKEAESIIESARKKSLKEKEDIISGAQTEIAEIAAAMADKIVKGNTSDTYDEFLTDAEKDEK